MGGLYWLSPRAAYNFIELVESHTYETYAQFSAEQEADLKAQPAPPVAIRYYRDGDIYSLA